MHFDLDDDTLFQLKGEWKICFQEILTWKMYKVKKYAIRNPALVSSVMDQKKLVEDVRVIDESYHKGRLKEVLFQLLKRRIRL